MRIKAMDGIGGEGMLCIAVVLCLMHVVFSATDPNDAKVISDFRKGLENPELLKWPNKGSDPCGPPSWSYVFCSSGRVTQIQVANLGLKGTLPQNFNQLTMLSNVGLQKNQFSGKLPTFSGLSQLQFAYLGFNEFDTIPSDFFHGLTSLRFIHFDENPFNATTGWSIPNELQDSVQLTNFSCASCNIAGPLPDFFGKFPSLSALRLSYNRLSGVIPASFRDSMLQVLLLNDQDGGGMSGSIDVIGSMRFLMQVWVHGNQFTGSIPDNIGDLANLQELNLNRNLLVGLIPPSLANMDLEILDLNNNMFMGPIPKFKARKATFSFNLFCQSTPGLQCAPEVNALLEFLHAMNYPQNVATEWSGNNPCEGPWFGISCDLKGKISVLNLPKRGFIGSLSSSLVNLPSLAEIHLEGNHLSGQVPTNLTELKSLRLLDISGNNFQPPLPKFSNSVMVNIQGNPLFEAKPGNGPPSPVGNTSAPSPASGQLSPVPSDGQFSPSQLPSNNSSGSNRSSPNPSEKQAKPENNQNSSKGINLGVVIGAAVVVIVLVLFFLYYLKRRRDSASTQNTLVVPPKDPSDHGNMVKNVVSSNTSGSMDFESGKGNGTEKSPGNVSGNPVVSVQVLQRVTNNFAPENELGRGGFGAVYKGELEDGTKIAVKRMEAGVLSSKVLDEFRSEIVVLSKVRHRHLVALLGYSIEGNERLLVYEYMPQGALSRHLFHWKSLNLEPLPWTRRLNIALDVARGMEYLHTLAHESFIHRDLKSSNILLGDDFRAKVSDFGLVKNAPDRERSIATRLAGTFGYLAPEYAVTGKITTKADVFSFGVVLMELLTGLAALDEQRSEESRYLAEWFPKIKGSKEKLIPAIDPALDAKEETFDTIFTIAELAGHCTARDPNHRPDMGHAVNVLAPLVEKWKPFNGEACEDYGIDYSLPLPDMLRGWQQSETSWSNLEDSKGSLPARPTGFADSFTSADAR